MSDYEQIRKRYLAGESQRSIAKTLGISRNTVARYCNGAAVPWERNSTVLTDNVTAFIMSCLEEDQHVRVLAAASFFTVLRNCHPRFPAFLDYVLPLGHADLGTNLQIHIRQETTPPF